jgi:hypothetical protein
MKQYRLIVLTTPGKGREDEYNEWYQNTHLPEVVAQKGFKSAQRFRVNKAMSPGHSWPYLAVYEIETDDIDKIFGQAGGKVSPTPPGLMDPNQYVVIYEEFGKKVTGGG